MADPIAVSDVRPLSRRLAFIFIAAILMTGAAGFAGQDAARAQETIFGGRSILNLFFKKPKAAPEPEARKPAKKRKAKRAEPTDSLVNGLTQDDAQVVVKMTDARKILVVGDFMASALGDGLTTAFETSADIEVIAKANGSSGLVRDDYYDWAAQLPILIDENKPSVVVVMIGANDRQQLIVNGSREKFQSEQWHSEYEKRVLRLAKIVTDRKLPLLWVGLTPFSSPSMSADAVILNGAYRNQAQKAGGEFVDIWEGFVDENGKFITTGSDVNGQSARLRGSDGLSLTKAGRRKIAFYLEKPIRHLIGAPDLSSALRLDTPSIYTLGQDKPEVVNIVSMPPVNLSDPAFDGSDVLLSASPVLSGSGQTPRDLLIEKGETGQAPAGRIDDYKIDKAPLVR